MTDLAAFRHVASAALVSDALDALGMREQCLPWTIVPATPESLLVGRAYTVTCEAVDGPSEAPYRGLLRALDGIGQDEVFTISTGAADQAAVWGELLSTACIARGAAGALTDGLVRDSAQLRKLAPRFPVFSRGTVPYDISGRFEITGVGASLTFGGVEIRARALLVGDCDGVVVVPAEAESEVVRRVIEKAAGEDEFRAAVEGGMPPSLAYEKYGVL